jgi:hypothetical protein
MAKKQYHLVTSANIVITAVEVNTCCNVWRLLIKGQQYVADLVIKT